MTSIRKSIYTVCFHLRTGAIAAGMICLVVFLLALGIGLPVYLVWQGGWIGLLGLLIYSILLSFGRVINNRI